MKSLNEDLDYGGSAKARETNVNVSLDGFLKGNGLGIYHNVLGFWNGNGKWKIDNWSLWMQE